MSIIVGRGESKLQCDNSGCRNESSYVVGENDGQTIVREFQQKKGWQCMTNGKDYCPDHAFGNSAERQR